MEEELREANLERDGLRSLNERLSAELKRALEVRAARMHLCMYLYSVSVYYMMCVCVIIIIMCTTCTCTCTLMIYTTQSCVYA